MGFHAGNDRPVPVNRKVHVVPEVGFSGHDSGEQVVSFVGQSLRNRAHRFQLSLGGNDMKKVIVIGFVVGLTGCVTLKPKFSFHQDSKEVKVGLTVGIGKDSLKAWGTTLKSWFSEDENSPGAP